jgi:hypothetical protein
MQKALTHQESAKMARPKLIQESRPESQGETVEEVWKALFAARSVAGLSHCTICGYSRRAIPFLDFIGRETPLKDLGLTHIHQYIQSLQNCGKLN